MKVGIVTFHRAHNYGAVLQAYALQSYLKFLGCEVFFIDHKNESMLSCYKIWDVHRFISKHPTKMLNKIQNEVRLIKHRINRYNKFKNFLNSFFCLKNASSSNVRLFDLIIVGSDQVWNTHLTNGFDDYYWGNLNIREDARIISYAASIEEYWNETDNTKAKNLLNKFNAISVREQNTAEYLRNFLDKDINVTIDPTLLVDSSVWEKFAQKPSLADNYLLFYQVRNSPECESYAEEISKKLGLRLIVLSARVDQANSKECIDSSPEEFVGWFKYASYVICTSFHGTVFSVIFKRPFVSIKLGDGKNARVESFLKSIDLSERLVEVDSMIPSINIDWDTVNLRLSKQQTKSRQYLGNFML